MWVFGEMGADKTGEVVPPVETTMGGAIGGNTVQNMNFHHAKIDVTKFDGKINFGM